MTMKEEVILDILGLTHQYGFEDLERAISDVLVLLLCMRNVCTLLDTARLYNLEKLTTVCLVYLDIHASEILKHDSFVTLSQVNVERVVDDRGLNWFCRIRWWSCWKGTRFSLQRWTFSAAFATGAT